MPEPLFLLSPGRSFSSVVSTMIGEHPDCYGLPELKIFSADTIGESWEKESRPGSWPMQGLKRTVAELAFGEQTDETVDAAEAWIRERFDWSGRQMMDWFQERVGDRILIDKSPANTENPGNLGRIVKAFPQANFLLLLRHPRPRGKSQYSTISKVLQKSGVGGMGFEPDVEWKWTGTNIMARRLGQDLALGQFMHIRGEALLREMDVYLPQICEWLGIRTDAEAIDAMRHPERSPFATLGPTKAAHGNNGKFLKGPALDFERLATMPDASLEGPLDWDESAEFTAQTRRLAHVFGYR